MIEFFPEAGDFGCVKPKRVRLFIKPYCPWCHRATRWLNERGIDYETVDVTGDELAFDEMIRLSGQELAPVIEVDGKVLADFGPEQLADFWEELELPVRAPARS
jgi:glutaredoxin